MLLYILLQLQNCNTNWKSFDIYFSGILSALILISIIGIASVLSKTISHLFLCYI